MTTEKVNVLPTSTNLKDRIGITKVPLSLIPLSAMMHAALAHLDGACKYTKYNWRRESVAASVYVDAALRHILKWFHGSEYDADSGVHHLGHAIACLNIILDAREFHNMVDDRPVADASPAMLDAFRDEVRRILQMHGQDMETTPIVDSVHGPLIGKVEHVEMKTDDDLDDLGAWGKNYDKEKSNGDDDLEPW